MQKTLLVMIILFVMSTFSAGCSVLENRAPEVKVGELILNQDKITSVQITEVEGSKNIRSVTLTHPSDIDSIIAMVNDITVKPLTLEEEQAFMPTRIMEKHLTIAFDDNMNPNRIMQGRVFMWPDGYVLATDIESMASSKRTISYSSESRYPEIYDKLCGEMQHNNGALTAMETSIKFVQDRSYRILVNSGANYDLQLPGSFGEIKNGVQIGALLKEKNELSKHEGLDFSNYLGKQVTLVTYGVEDKDNVFANVDLVMDGNTIVGFWVDDHGEPADFNIIVNAYECDHY